MEGDAGTGRLNPDDSVPAESEPAARNAVAETRPGDDGPQGVSRLSSRGWLVGVCATLLVLAAVVASGGYLVLRSNQEAAALAQTEASATQAAKDCVAATQAPNTAAMAESQQKILDCATGDYAAQARLYSGVLVDAYQAANAQVEVTDIRAAVERHNIDGSVDVLVALRVKMSNTQVQEQEIGYRLRVQMSLDEGAYKIARLDQVTT
ncbi:MAG: hypothetical protein WBB07_12030 [Mycobacterium sp.]